MLLAARHISFSYRTDAPVLRDVSISVAEKQIVVLIGPNGSGKSTLLRVLMGHVRAEGEVTWEGRAVAKWRPRELARAVAYLPQAPVYDPGMTVAETLRAGRTPYLGALGIESAEDVAVVQRVAGELGLLDLMRRPLDELSGGQRQLVFLGRALAQEPRALLLDEPGTFLDLRHQVDMWRRLRELAGRGIAVIAASHDLQLSAGAADEMVLLDQGSIAARGSPEEVLKPELLTKVYGVAMERVERAGGPPLLVPV